MKFLNIKFEKDIEKGEGITLVALVITIVVLLILAGTALAMVIGEEVILAKASEAAFRQEIDAVRDIFNRRSNKSRTRNSI